MSFFSKVGKVTKRICKNFCSDCHFSLCYAFLGFFGEIGRFMKLSGFSKKIKSKREKYIYSYLTKNLNHVIDNFKNQSFSGEKNTNSPIWICWWTGEEHAPPLVKQCIKSIRNNANNHKVILICKDNFNQYLDIPEYMLKKSQNGNMCLAHLCDYIRICLLYKYGGLWLDSTIFCSSQINEDYFNIPFFTCRSEYDESCTYISKMRWTTFVLGSYKNNFLLEFLKQALEHYWKNNKVAIDYLFFDYLFELAYNNNSSAKKLIDDVPPNNLHRDDLQAAMNKSLSANNFHNIITSDTILYKLSWRETYNLKTEDGLDSIYSYFLGL